MASTHTCMYTAISRRLSKHTLSILLVIAYVSYIVLRILNQQLYEVGDDYDDEKENNVRHGSVNYKHRNQRKENKVIQKEERLVPSVFDADAWAIPKVPVRLQTAAWHDKRLVDHIRDHWIIPPYPRTSQAKSRHLSQARQSEIVDDIFEKKTNGFFIECGAADGVHLSDTIFFEETRNWTGLLIEVDPNLFSDLLRSERHSYMTNACLSPHDHAVVLEYTIVNHTLLGGLSDYMEPSHHRNTDRHDRHSVMVQCFPLASILSAIGVSQIDYMSLDVEGSELSILKSIPFSSVDIDVMSVEYRIIGNVGASETKLKNIKDFMIGKHHYKEIQTTENLDIILKLDK